MSESRLAAVTIIVLVVFAGLLATNPNVTGFFASMAKKTSSIFDNDRVERNIEFSANLDRYAPINSTARNVSIMLEGDTRIALDNGNIITGLVTVYGYNGKISISGKMLLLEGASSAVETKELLLRTKSNIRLESDFSRAEIRSLAIKNLDAYNASGTLTVKETETSFSGSIRISEPLADFIFDSNMLSLTGKAKKIVIPDSGINIS